MKLGFFVLNVLRILDNSLESINNNEKYFWILNKIGMMMGNNWINYV